MVLSEEEKRKRHAEASRRYREKIKNSPAKLARDRRSTKRSQVYNFILKEATRAEVDHMHGLLNKRTEILDILDSATKPDDTKKNSDKK